MLRAGKTRGPLSRFMLARGTDKVAGTLRVPPAEVPTCFAPERRGDRCRASCSHVARHTEYACYFTHTPCAAH